MDQGTVTKILSPTALGGPRMMQSKFRPRPLKILRNWGKTFWGWVHPGAPGGKMLGVGPKLKTEFPRGTPPVQNDAISGALGL